MSAEPVKNSLENQASPENHDVNYEVGNSTKQKREVSTQVSPGRERRRRKCKKVKISDLSRWERLQAGCLELMQELDDLGKEMEEEHLRRNWFTGVRVLLNRPIHSMWVKINTLLSYANIWVITAFYCSVLSHRRLIFWTSPFLTWVLWSSYLQKSRFSNYRVSNFTKTTNIRWVARSYRSRKHLRQGDAYNCLP